MLGHLNISINSLTETKNCDTVYNVYKYLSKCPFTGAEKQQKSTSAPKSPRPQTRMTQFVWKFKRGFVKVLVSRAVIYIIVLAEETVSL